jgi:hypothetical protein
MGALREANYFTFNQATAAAAATCCLTATAATADDQVFDIQSVGNSYELGVSDIREAVDAVISCCVDRDKRHGAAGGESSAAICGTGGVWYEAQ